MNKSDYKETHRIRDLRIAISWGDFKDLTPGEKARFDEAIKNLSMLNNSEFIATVKMLAESPFRGNLKAPLPR